MNRASPEATNSNGPFPSSLARGGTCARAGNILPVAFALSAFSLEPTAYAVEREQHLGVDIGGSVLVVSDKTAADIGPSVGAHWTYGLSDAFDLLVEGGWSIAALREKPGPMIASDRPTWLANAGVGIGYVFDVLEWVPYAGLLVGGDALSGGTLDHSRLLPDAVIAIGLDYRWSPRWALGVALRQHLFLSDSATYPTFTQAFVRLEYTWGW